MSLRSPSSAVAVRLAGPFSGLDWRDPALWPPLPLALLCALVALGVALPAWGLLSASAGADLAAARAREAALRQAFTAKLAQSAQLAPLRQRRQELQDLAADLERRLPPPGRLDALLSALHLAAQRHGLQVELIRPEPAQSRAPLAEVPIALRLSGRFHALGAFAADVAALETPVTLHALQLGAGSREAVTTLEALARAWHQRDPAEAPRPATPPGAAPGATP